MRRGGRRRVRRIHRRRVEGAWRHAHRRRPALGGSRGRRFRQRGKSQEEDAYGVLAFPSIPVGVDVRRQTLPIVVGTQRSGFRFEAHRNAGENLVPEPPQQVETPTGGRGGSHYADARRPADGPGTNCLPTAATTADVT